jgi:hypothetical protein
MQAEWMVWLGSMILILSYILIPRRPYFGWIASFTGNSLYLYPVSTLHKLSLMVVPVVFTALSIWNVIRCLNSQKSSVK